MESAKQLLVGAQVQLAVRSLPVGTRMKLKASSGL